MGIRPGVLIYFDLAECMKNALTYEELGKMFCAIMDYAKTDEIPQLDPVLKGVWAFVQPQIDLDGEAYADKCAKGTYAAFCKSLYKVGGEKISYDDWQSMSLEERKRMLTPGNDRERPLPPDNHTQPITDTVTDTVTDTITDSIPNVNNSFSIKADKPPKKKKFAPPSVEEVSAYCKEMGFTFDPEYFVDYHTSKGWTIGKAQSPMRDWKAAARTWARNSRKEAATDGGNAQANNIPKSWNIPEL